jgi:hypothetical protein
MHTSLGEHGGGGGVAGECTRAWSCRRIEQKQQSQRQRCKLDWLVRGGTWLGVGVLRWKHQPKDALFTSAGGRSLMDMNSKK